MRRVVCRTGLVLALIGLAVAGGTPARAAGLSLVRPHEGDAVRETRFLMNGGKLQKPCKAIVSVVM